MFFWFDVFFDDEGLFFVLEDDMGDGFGFYLDVVK